MNRLVNVKLPLREGVRLTCDEVVFGKLNGSDLINLMILVAKQFIVEQRYRDGLFDVSLFRAAVLKIFLMEKCNAEM